MRRRGQTCRRTREISPSGTPRPTRTTSTGRPGPTRLLRVFLRPSKTYFGLSCWRPGQTLMNTCASHPAPHDGQIARSPVRTPPLPSAPSPHTLVLPALPLPCPCLAPALPLPCPCLAHALPMPMPCPCRVRPLRTSPPTLLSVDSTRRGRSSACRLVMLRARFALEAPPRWSSSRTR